uniref:Reactive oxygen species modulator 1 n=2 Tax=Ascaris TaxID=6251 RepID=A0A0M3HUR6_ASCLU
MAVPQGYQVVGGGQQPSCWTKLKLGFMMGAVIGGATGVLLGSYAAFRMGLRGKEMVVQIGKIAAQSGGSFGIFMMVAQGLRC